MRFHRITVKGLGPFHEEATLDLDQVPGTLVSVQGINGSGKSTLCELLTGGAAFRQCATRGSLVDLATSRDAFLEVSFSTDKPYVVRHSADKISEKSTALLTNGDGRPVIAGTSVRLFDAWVKEHLPSEEELYSSTVSPQGSGGLLAMREGDRKACLLRTLGVERLEKMAERARKRAADARQALAVVDARIADERRRGLDVGKLEAERAVVVETAAGIAAEFAKAATALEEATSRLARGEREQETVRAHAARAAELAARREALVAQDNNLQARIVNNRGVLARADEVGKAVARQAEIRARLDVVVGDLEVKQTTFSTLNGALQADQAKIASLRAQRTATLARRDRAVERLGNEDLIADAERQLADLPRVEAGNQGALAKVEAALAESRALQLDGAARRIARLRVGHEQDLAIDLDAYDEYQPLVVAMMEGAQSALMDDDAIAEACAKLPTSLAKLDEAHRETQKDARELATTRRSLEGLAARRAGLDAAKEERDAGEAEASRLLDEIVRAVEAQPNALAITTLHDELVLLRQERQVLSNEAAALGPVAQLAGPLAQAEARVAELAPQRAQVRKDLDVVDAEIVALGPTPLATPLGRLQRELDEAKTTHKCLATDEQNLSHSLTRIDVALETARASVARLGELDAERAPLVEAVEDWKKLGDDLGRDGLQALEIDAAGPEFSELTNDLLHGCFGPRFTVTVEATRLDAGGKKMLEGLEIRVLDLQEGREAGGETFSGGEKVILSEALSLALTIMGCRRAGVSDPTLVRDESGAALDPVNSRAWIAMLRRAAEMIGASKVLFVAHNPELWELADARVTIADGRIAVSA